MLLPNSITEICLIYYLFNVMITCARDIINVSE